MLDVGTGGADVPTSLARWARRAGRRIRILALDRDPPTLAVARRAAARYPEIVLLQGDALALPVRPRSVDVVISGLTLHHLEPAAAVRYLAEMDATARVGFVVNAAIPRLKDLEIQFDNYWLLILLGGKLFSSGSLRGILFP